MFPGGDHANLRTSTILLLLFVFALTRPARALAQAGTSGLTGVVADPSGTAMDRVHIVVLDPATGFGEGTSAAQIEP